jgi:hypothetical protein
MCVCVVFVPVCMPVSISWLMRCVVHPHLHGGIGGDLSRSCVVHTYFIRGNDAGQWRVSVVVRVGNLPVVARSYVVVARVVICRVSFPGCKRGSTSG